MTHATRFPVAPATLGAWTGMWAFVGMFTKDRRIGVLLHGLTFR